MCVRTPIDPRPAISKLDLATSVAGEIADRLAATIAAHPDASFLEVLDRWLVGEEQVLDPDLYALGETMFETNATLLAVIRAQASDTVPAGGSALVAKIRLPTAHPMVEVAGGRRCRDQLLPRCPGA